ncbi:phosphoribosylaminoimidazolesuccinocarboxamide synthase [bacterium]|nr:phosphoribosylaminoimidazolesuccinocarboxamide synthase [bacterium]
MKKLTEGKTKIIYDVGEGRVIMFSKDDITAGDGTQKDVIPGKGAVATKTTANVFRLLNRHSIPTHFIEQIDAVRLLCIKCEMIPLEVTIRGTAAGHYVKRNPNVNEGIDLEELVVDFTFKDDARHDPLVVVAEYGTWELHNPEQPVSSDTLIEEIPPLLSAKEVYLVEEIGKRTFYVLKEAWGKIGVKLIDLKIEFGQTEDNRLIIADVIDNDSWRLWPGGDKSRQLDKQIYREGGTLDEVLRNYKIVADMTDQFANTA